MKKVESADVLALHDVKFDAILKEINAKRERPPMAWVMPLVLLGAGFVFGPLLWLAAIFAIWLGRWIDSYTRTTVLLYDLEEEPRRDFEALVQAFEHLAQCDRAWHASEGGAVETLAAWKRHSGVSHVVKLDRIQMSLATPSIIKSNIDAPQIPIGRRTLHFFPDFVMVVQDRRAGIVDYRDLNFRIETTRFVETDDPPSDARIVGKTWKHPNKDGGPDRRFNDNRLVPICLYEAIHLSTRSGLSELVQVSQIGRGQALAGAASALARYRRDVEPGALIAAPAP